MTVPATAVDLPHFEYALVDGTVVARIGRQRSPCQQRDAVADEFTVRVQRVLTMAAIGEHLVHRLSDVAQTVDQGTVEVEQRRAGKAA